MRKESNQDESYMRMALEHERDMELADSRRPQVTEKESVALVGRPAILLYFGTSWKS